MKILVEKTRKDLLNKSRSADKTKSYGTTRFDRRNHQHLYNGTANFNEIDMNSVFKGNLLSLRVPVRGETNMYEVKVIFEGICDDIQREIKNNRYVCEFKPIYRAIIDSINKQDIYVSCSCPDFKFRFAA